MGMIEEKFLNDIGFRQYALGEIRTNNEIIQRMSDSAMDIECYNGKLSPYLELELQRRFSKETVLEMPKISQINLSKKIANSKGQLYSNPPDRKFFDLNDDQKEKLQTIYYDMNIDSKNQKSNRFFELQKQNHILITPKKGKICETILPGHRLNVIPSELDPEVGEVYIISTFDETQNKNKVYDGDYLNQTVGDKEDYKALLERHYIYSPNYHYVIDGKGNILSESVINEIAPLIPIVEIADEKDGKYWVDSGSEITKFAIEFASQLSNWAHIVNLQAFAQAYLKGPQDLQPSTIKIGPNYILRLITKPDENKDIEFGYANPNSDLNGVKDLVLSLLSLFQSTEEVNPMSVSASGQSQNFASGLERLLAMIESFKPSKEAKNLYENAEQRIFAIVKAWHDALIGSDLLDQKYKTSAFGDKGSMSIKFQGPENILSESDELAIIESRLENKTMTRKKAIMRLENVDEEEAKEIIKEIDEEEQERFLPGVQPKMVENDIEEGDDNGSSASDSSQM